MRSTRALAWIVAALLASACGSDGPRAPLAPSPTTTPVALDGRWTGQTAQGERVTFVVSGNVVGQLALSVSYSLPTCNGGFSFFTSSPVATVTGGSFSAGQVVPGPPSGSGFEWTVTGTFESATLASGTVRVRRPAGQGSPCAVEVDVQTAWRAAR